jgi:hypothetical protein
MPSEFSKLELIPMDFIRRSTAPIFICFTARSEAFIYLTFLKLCAAIFSMKIHFYIFSDCLQRVT